MLIRIASVFFLLISPSALASFSLEQVLRVAKNEAYRSAHVNWPKVERAARLLNTTQGEDAAINSVLVALGDPHTRYLTPEQLGRTPTLLKSQKSTPIAQLIGDGSGYPILRINRWSGTDTRHATSLVSTTLTQALLAKPCGIVLDFTQNSGGNMWPMLVGLAPLLTDGKLGSFKTANGSVKLIEKNDGQIWFDGARHALDTRVLPANLTTPSYIAILIGPKTASSGEITPLMFYGQSDVRFVGKKSAGLTSANSVYPLPNGGRLVLTTAMTLNRNDQAFATGITPDEQSAEPVQAADRWLTRQCTR